MDEILASIRRIISEDAAAPGVADAPAAPVEDDDVLLLRERAPADPFIYDPPAAEVATAEPKPEPRSRPEPAVQAPAVVEPAPASAAASFERLYFVVENTAPSPPPVAVSASGPTLEDLTRQMLQPMLKAWLDENLDAIVRARVDEEVERIARGRVR